MGVLFTLTFKSQGSPAFEAWFVVTVVQHVVVSGGLCQHRDSQPSCQVQLSGACKPAYTNWETKEREEESVVYSLSKPTAGHPRFIKAMVENLVNR